MIGAKPVAHTPNEHCDVGALTPTIGVKLTLFTDTILRVGLNYQFH
jgi:hypothetical protein